MIGRTSRQAPREPGVWPQSLQTHLLLQDFNLHVVPYRDAGDAYELSVQGMSIGQVNQALSLWDHRRGADGFVSEVASTLLTEREAWLEVIFKPDGGDGLPFRPLLVHGVRRTATGNLIQEVPKLESPNSPFQGELERQPQRIDLDEERMVHVGLPAKYPNRLLAKIAKVLAEVDSNHNLAPLWFMEQLTGQRENAPSFDSGEAMRTERLRIAQATLPIGWTAREIYYGENRHLGDYYYYWRELRFLHFRSSLRECAEQALRQVLIVAGAKCGFEAQVTAHGLYTPVEVEEIVTKYEAGEIPFSAMNSIVFERPNPAQSKVRWTRSVGQDLGRIRRESRC